MSDKAGYPALPFVIEALDPDRKGEPQVIARVADHDTGGMGRRTGMGDGAGIQRARRLPDPIPRHARRRRRHVRRRGRAMVRFTTKCCSGCNASGEISDDETVIRWDCGSFIGTHDDAEIQRSRECLARGERFHRDVASRQAKLIMDLENRIGDERTALADWLVSLTGTGVAGTANMKAIAGAILLGEHREGEQDG